MKVIVFLCGIWLGVVPMSVGLMGIHQGMCDGFALVGEPINQFMGFTMFALFVTVGAFMTYLAWFDKTFSFRKVTI